MTAPLSFQGAILTLQRFWSEHGCLIWQPYNQQIGAGTMNPATALRVLGPEPWKVAYVEPSIRPDDGRYGENPNRLQQHYQYQVILQPDPGDPQELYLRSLAALGVDAALHDIRFVEDNWEQPAIGAWGLGWEVWLDGQEITQFTYFQQVGGVTLDPVAVELTYGLERILIALQRVKGFRDIRWTDDITYGEVNLQAEQQHSHYYFEVADVERLRSLYDLYQAEAATAMQAGLLLPAYDYALKCSHAFNVLDTRGAVGVTERARFFGDMRALVRQVAQGYVEQRRDMGFPLLAAEQDKAPAVPVPDLPQPPADPQPYLLEIGVEELPAGDLADALAQLREQVPARLAEQRLSHGDIHVWGTPRRLALLIEALPLRQQPVEKIVRGPSVRHAYDAGGKPTRAAQGFARGQGVAVSDLERREMEGGEYVVAMVREEERPLPEVLAEIAPAILDGLRFECSMRWLPGADSVAFSRPIRRLLSLLGSERLPFAYAGLVAGRETRALRAVHAQPLEVPEASAYAALLAQHRVMLDPVERRERIAADARRLAAGVEGEIAPDDELLAEVANLVECPTAFLGEFNPDFLRLPQPVLIAVMKKQQRYFPVVKDGALLPFFVGVRNGAAENLELVVKGNEHVIRARFADASYFVRQDSQRALSQFRAELSRLAFQEQLGSMLDKSERIEKLTAKLAALLGLDTAEGETALRAAHLAKADLATSMVVEMTALQGVMGCEYALAEGETAEVARAIEEHYWPLGAGGKLPHALAGLTVGLADRLDSLVGLFAVGLEPTGAADPFGQRRAALGAVQLLLGRQLDFDLRGGLQAAAALQPVAADDAVEQAAGFLLKRLRGVLRERGHRADVVEAALAVQGGNPWRAQQAAEQLSVWVARADWQPTLDAFARCVRILPDGDAAVAPEPELFREDAERELWVALQAAESALAAQSEPPGVDDFLSVFTPTIPAITRFFDAVLVMDADPAVRVNRLALLRRVAALADGTVDLSKLEGF